MEYAYKMLHRRTAEVGTRVLGKGYGEEEGCMWI